MLFLEKNLKVDNHSNCIKIKTRQNKELKNRRKNIACMGPFISISSRQQNLIKTFQYESMIAMIAYTLHHASNVLMKASPLPPQSTTSPGPRTAPPTSHDHLPHVAHIPHPATPPPIIMRLHVARARPPRTHALCDPPHCRLPAFEMCTTHICEASPAAAGRRGPERAMREAATWRRSCLNQRRRPTRCAGVAATASRQRRRRHAATVASTAWRKASRRRPPARRMCVPCTRPRACARHTCRAGSTTP